MSKQNEVPPGYVSIDPAAIRQNAERNRADADMIVTLTQGIESLAKENASLVAKLKEATDKIAAFTSAPKESPKEG